MTTTTYFGVVMQWVLYLIVTAMATEKIGIMATGGDVHTVTAMENKNIWIFMSLPSQCERTIKTRSHYDGNGNGKFSIKNGLHWIQWRCSHGDLWQLFSYFHKWVQWPQTEVFTRWRHFEDIKLTLPYSVNKALVLIFKNNTIYVYRFHSKDSAVATFIHSCYYFRC